MRALDKLVAKARDIIPVEGGTFMRPSYFLLTDRFTLGALPMACLLYKWAKEEFEAANEAFNKIAKTVGPRPSVFVRNSSALPCCRPIWCSIIFTSNHIF